jgi:signal transduction histidine kinase
MVVVRVSDSGPGFVDLDHAFDAFYTTMPVGQGTGLGLSICYGTIQEHDGRIYAHNLQPGGAAITIELPVNIGGAYGRLQNAL